MIAPRAREGELAVGLQPFKNLAALLIEDAQADRPRRPRDGGRLTDDVRYDCGPDLAFADDGGIESASDAKELKPELLRPGLENPLKLGQLLVLFNPWRRCGRVCCLGCMAGSIAVAPRRTLPR